MAGRAFLVWSGLALCGAAVLLVAVNAGLTPQLPRGDLSRIAASEVFLWRQSLAAAAALLMTFGVVGVFAAQAGRVGVFGAAAFVLAVSGCLTLFATEWAQIFVVRDLALHNGPALDRLENAPGMTWFDVGALAAFVVFALGWILFAISIALAGAFSRLSAALVLAGFLLAPALGGFGVWGAAAGSALIASGWFWIGVQLMRGTTTPSGIG